MKGIETIREENEPRRRRRFVKLTLDERIQRAERTYSELNGRLARLQARRDGALVALARLIERKGGAK